MKKLLKLCVWGSIGLVLVIPNVAQAQLLSRVSGHVIVAADSTPVADFPLLLSKVSAGPGPERYLATTDAKGYYSTLVAPGTYNLSTIDTSIYKPKTISNIKVDVGQNVTVNLALVLQNPDAVIAGHVSSSGTAVAGVDIFLYRIGGNHFSLPSLGDDPKAAIYKTVTDQNGDFKIEVLAGSYLLYIPRTPQYLPFWSAPIFVGVGDTAKVKIELVRTPLLRTISGTVFNHKNFQWVLLTAHSLTLGRIFSGLPKADGRYTINALPDKYMVRCDAFVDGLLYTVYYDSVTLPQEAKIVDASNDVSGIDFRLPSPGVIASFTIQGSVVDEGTGAPVPGAYISFVGYNLHYGDSLASRFHVRADQQGNYSFTGRTFFDQVTLIGAAYQDGYFPEFYDNQPTFLTATPVVVKATETVTGINFSLSKIQVEPGFSISGTLLGENGMPVPFGEVIAYSTVGIKYAQTDDRGFYKLEGFPQGTHVILQAWGAPGYIPEFYDNKFSVLDADVLVMDANKTDINFVLAKRSLQTAFGRIRGLVRSSSLLQTTANLNGVTLYVKKSNATEWYAADYVDANGEFSLPIETYGQYEVKVTAWGHSDFKTVVEINETTGLFVEGLQINLTPTVTQDFGTGNVIRSAQLFPAYPNPVRSDRSGFNPSTVITVEMGKSEKVTLAIYNVLGQKVVTLHEGVLRQGFNKFVWQGKSDSGIAVAPGIYFCQLKTDHEIQTRSVTFLK